MGHLDHIPFLHGLGIITEERVQRLPEPKGVDGSSDKVSTRHGNTVVYGKSDWHAPDLHKIKPTIVPAWVWEGFLKFHLLCSYWQLMVTRLGRSSFRDVVITLALNLYIFTVLFFSSMSYRWMQALQCEYNNSLVVILKRAQPLPEKSILKIGGF